MPPRKKIPTKASSKRQYIETFDDGPSGWISNRYHPLLVRDGVAYCHSPWWVDGNHAPPGAGYLSLVMYLITNLGNFPKETRQSRLCENNRFASGGYSRNLTHAKLTVRLRGELDAQGAQLLLLVQGTAGKVTANYVSSAYVLSAQPIKITPDWSEQSLTLTPDPSQWTCIGARHNLTQVYGNGDIAKLLADVDFDLIFVLFPINVVPLNADPSKRDQLWVGRDYTADPAYLPNGLLMFDTVTIDYPE